MPKVTKVACSVKKEKKDKKSKKMNESAIPSDKQFIVGFINNILNKEYAKASENLQSTIDEKLKNKISKIANSK